MHDYDLEPERIKLATVLGLDTSALPDLSPLNSFQVRRLRQGLSDAIYLRHRTNYARLAKLSKLLPVKLTAKLTETALGPELAAGVTCELEPARAAKISLKLSTAFLAQLSIHLDPGRAGDVLAALAPEVIVAVARELASMQAYVTLARFVASIRPATLAAVIAELDDRTLHHVGLLIEQRDRLGHVLELLPIERRINLLRIVDSEGAWPQTLALLSHLGDRVKGYMGDSAVALGEKVLNRLLDITHQHKLWRPLLEAIVHMQPDAQRRVFAMPALRQRPVVEAFLTAVTDEEMWPLLARTWHHAPASLLQVAFENLCERPTEVLEQLFLSAIQRGYQGALLAALKKLPAPVRSQFQERAQRDFEGLFRTVIAHPGESTGMLGD